MIEKYFKLAAEVAQLREDGRIFLLGCVAIRGGDQAVVLSSNSPVMIGNLGTNERTSFPPAHAEMKCAKKMSKHSIVFIARIRKDTKNYALARPCPYCMNMLLAKNAVKIYYSIDQYTYGVINVKGKEIVSENIRSF